MGSIGRYIFRTTFSAFVVILVSVTALMWVTQALRNFDLMTNQGQTILVFIGITGLIIPLLVLLIAPIALMIAVAHVLNRLGNDSELIVMNSAGMPPWKVLRPFLAVGIVVSIMVGAISIYLSPMSLRELRRWGTEVRAEVVSNNLQPGQFRAVDGLLTLHVRNREPNGQMTGILIDDRRDPKERLTILAQKGDILTNDAGVYLILETGTVQRHETGARDPAIVGFEDYAFDLTSILAGERVVRYSTAERYFWDVWNPSPDDPLFKEIPGQFRAEIHNRITAALYPIVFVVLTFAYLGAPRTTRQSRIISIVNAISAVAIVRGLGFLGIAAGVRTPAMLLVPYVTLAIAFALGLWGIARGLIIEPPAFITNAAAALIEGLARRTAALTGQAP